MLCTPFADILLGIKCQTNTNVFLVAFSSALRAAVLRFTYRKCLTRNSKLKLKNINDLYLSASSI